MSDAPPKPFFIAETASGTLLIINRTPDGDLRDEYPIVVGGNFRFDGSPWRDIEVVSDDDGNSYQIWTVGAEIPGKPGLWSVHGLAYVDPSVSGDLQPEAFALSYEKKFTDLAAVKINGTWYLGQ
jgi:hypothetical protein